MRLRRLWLPLLLMLPLSAHGNVVLQNDLEACTVVTSQYRLRVDMADPGLLSIESPSGVPLIDGLEGPAAQTGNVYLRRDPAASPHLHTIRAGRYMVEMLIENIVMTQGSAAWPGLGELRITCHEDKVYLAMRLLVPDGEWVRAAETGPAAVVYRRPEGHPELAGKMPVSQLRLWFSTRAKARQVESGVVIAQGYAVGIAPTFPTGATVAVSPEEGRIDLGGPPREAVPDAGSAAEAAWVLCIARRPAEARAAMRLATHPLPTDAFEATQGSIVGHNPRTGIYEMIAQTSNTPTPPPGTTGGTQFTVTNDSTRRTILVHSVDAWGGICGGMLRDETGLPLPIPIQFGLNFPEHHQTGGEPGWATLTFPLSLAPDQKRTVHAEHLYGGAKHHDLLYLTSLENIGDPLLLQGTVNTAESFTLTTGPYPAPLDPGNVFRVNDFRRHAKDIQVRSVSAILPSFFGYYDESDTFQGLMPGAFEITESGPFLAEVLYEAATPDGRVTAEARIWEVPSHDMTRLFTHIRLHVREDIRLAPDRAAPLFLLRHHAFNPMAFGAYAAWVEGEKMLTGLLPHMRTVHANGLPLGDKPFGLLYAAVNEMDQGLPCSDITGNAGWVLTDFEAQGVDLRPGLYAFSTGAEEDPSASYARDLAVAPVERLAMLPAGAEIQYTAVQMVYGDAATDPTTMQAERHAWAVEPLRVEATVGTVEGHMPPSVRAQDEKADVTIRGGKDWMAVRVTGFSDVGSLRVRITAEEEGDAWTMSLPSDPTAPWYVAWPDGNGGIGYTFLVHLPGDGRALRVKVSHRIPGSTN